MANNTYKTTTFLTFHNPDHGMTKTLQGNQPKPDPSPNNPPSCAHSNIQTFECGRQTRFRWPVHQRAPARFTLKLGLGNRASACLEGRKIDGGNATVLRNPNPYHVPHRCAVIGVYGPLATKRLLMRMRSPRPAFLISTQSA